MKVEISVIDYENELWFELNGVKFDTLHAIWELNRRTLEVVRAGNIVARARITEARGDPVFADHGDNKDFRIYGSGLHAEDFNLGDKVMLDVPEGFDLADDLRKHYWFLQNLIAIIPVGEKMTMDEMRNRLAPELIRTEPRGRTAQVLRFRRGK